MIEAVENGRKCRLPARKRKAAQAEVVSDNGTIAVFRREARRPESTGKYNSTEEQRDNRSPKTPREYSHSHKEVEMKSRRDTRVSGASQEKPQYETASLNMLSRVPRKRIRDGPAPYHVMRPKERSVRIRCPQYLEDIDFLRARSRSWSDNVSAIDIALDESLSQDSKSQEG